jgi:hypothetical protein
VHLKRDKSVAELIIKNALWQSTLNKDMHSTRRRASVEALHRTRCRVVRFVQPDFALHLRHPCARREHGWCPEQHKICWRMHAVAASVRKKRADRWRRAEDLSRLRGHVVSASLCLSEADSLPSKFATRFLVTVMRSGGCAHPCEGSRRVSRRPKDSLTGPLAFWKIRLE